MGVRAVLLPTALTRVCPGIAGATSKAIERKSTWMTTRLSGAASLVALSAGLVMLASSLGLGLPFPAAPGRALSRDAWQPRARSAMASLYSPAAWAWASFAAYGGATACGARQIRVSRSLGLACHLPELADLMEATSCGS